MVRIYTETIIASVKDLQVAYRAFNKLVRKTMRADQTTVPRVKYAITAYGSAA